MCEVVILMLFLFIYVRNCFFFFLIFGNCPLQHIICSRSSERGLPFNLMRGVQPGIFAVRVILRDSLCGILGLGSFSGCSVSDEFQ